MEPDNTQLTSGLAASRGQSSTPPVRMNEDVTREQDIFARHRLLVQWVATNSGYFHEHVQLAYSSRKGFHGLVADGHTIAEGTRIASCPMPLTLSVLNALDIHPFSSHGSRFPESFLSVQAKQPQSLQAFFLMEQMLKGTQSWWHPYISTLPTVQDVNELQFEDQADLMWLEGTNLKGGLVTQSEKWLELFTTGLTHLKTLSWPNALNGSYTWELFRWAATIFGSRSFTSQVLDDTLPADKARLAHLGKGDSRYDIVRLFSDHFGVLLPLLDIFNHRPGAQVEWQARYSFVGLQVLESYAAGQELSNNYGPKDNESLLLAYGFTIPNNPFDHVVIALKSRPGSMLRESRKWKKDLRSDPEHRCFIFDYQHPSVTASPAFETCLFSYDLLDTLSVECANEREMTTMQKMRQTIMSRCLATTPCFEDGRLILATLSQLSLDCSARAARLKATHPARSTPTLKPLGSKQQNAQVYRSGQLSIIETAAAVCAYVLRSATREATQAEILASLQQELPEHIFQNLKTLLKMHCSRLTRPAELLTSEDILDMLPVGVSDPLRRFIEQAENNLDQVINGALSQTIVLHKTRFAILLSALYGEFDRGVKLPHRVSAWIKTLSERYPLNTEWAFVPEPGPWPPGEEPPSTLMNLLESLSHQTSTESMVKQWLKPERIYWGYNVMEEMIVLVPTSVLLKENGNAQAAQDLVTVHLFWMHG